MVVERLGNHSSLNSNSLNSPRSIRAHRQAAIIRCHTDNRATFHLCRSFRLRKASSKDNSSSKRTHRLLAMVSSNHKVSKRIRKLRSMDRQRSHQHRQARVAQLRRKLAHQTIRAHHSNRVRANERSSNSRLNRGSGSSNSFKNSRSQYNTTVKGPIC